MTFEENLQIFKDAFVSLDGVTFKEPMSKEDRKILYTAAYGMYKVGDYDKASHLFTKLVLQDPFDACSWKGLASCHQMAKKYDEALQAWSVICLMTDAFPEAHFHAAECYLSLGNSKEAKKALANISEGHPLYERANALKERLYVSC